MRPLPRLNAIVDADAAAQARWLLADLARAFLDGGAMFLQLRGKGLAGGALLDAAEQVAALARERGAIVVVNDRADIARLAGADGVHLGQGDLPPAAARGLVGAAAVIGRSTHTIGQVERASREPVDYIAVGPVFRTGTKETGYDPVGLPLVGAAARIAAPVVAIGGITIENAAFVIKAGAASVAVISDLLATGDPAGRVRQYMNRLERI